MTAATHTAIRCVGGAPDRRWCLASSPPAAQPLRRRGRTRAPRGPTTRAPRAPRPRVFRSRLLDAARRGAAGFSFAGVARQLARGEAAKAFYQVCGAGGLLCFAGRWFPPLLPPMWRRVGGPPHGRGPPARMRTRKHAPPAQPPQNAVTHANGFVVASQAEAYGDITIAAGPRM